MRMFGFYLMLIGALSILLHFLDLNFIFLKWINQWGPSNGWLIRGGIILSGAILCFLGKKREEV